MFTHLQYRLLIHTMYVQCNNVMHRDEILEGEAKEKKPFAGDDTVDDTVATNGGGGEEEEQGGEGDQMIQADESGTRLGPPGPPFGIVINGASLVSGPDCIINYMYVQ